MSSGGGGSGSKKKYYQDINADVDDEKDKDDLDIPSSIFSMGSLHKVDCVSLNTVVHQYDQALDENVKKRNEFEKIKDGYIKLKTRLRTLPDKLEYEAMVPLCSKAICPGKIIHTNEILVLLGENIFVECTAKKAEEIIMHRLKSVDGTLNRLDNERELYNSWKFEAERQMVETLGDGTIEIMEEYDEEKETQWRLEHRSKVRKHHQELGKKRAAAISIVNNVGKTEEEEKLWTRLDALELEEEFMEAQAMYEQRMSGNVGQQQCTVKIRERERTSTPISYPDNKESEEAAMMTNPNSSGKKVTFSPDNIIHNLTDLNLRDFKKSKGGGGKELQSNSLITEISSTSENPDKIELYKPSECSNDNSLYDPIFIRFRHTALPLYSSSPPTPTPVTDNNANNDDNIANNTSTTTSNVLLVSSDSSDFSSSSEDDDEIDIDDQLVVSPGDIYEQFGPPSLEAKKSLVIPGADKTPLKSILKPRGPGGRSPQLNNKITKNSQNADETNAIIKKVLCETNSVVSVVAEQVTERVPNIIENNRTNADEDMIYAMFPGLASFKHNKKQPESSSTSNNTVGGANNHNEEDDSSATTDGGSGDASEQTPTINSTTHNTPEPSSSINLNVNLSHDKNNSSSITPRVSIFKRMRASTDNTN